MALARRSAVRLRVWDLLGEGSDLARGALRTAWAPILVLVAAYTVMFLNGHAAAGDWQPGPLTWIAPLALLAYAPLYGALYRAALGGPGARTRGLGGLQWSGVEWRLVVVGAVLVIVAGLVAVPFLAATGLAALLPGSHAPVNIGPFGTLSRWALAAIPIWLVFAVVAAPRLARLMLSWPFSVARGKIQPFGGFGISRRSGWGILVALVLAQGPILLSVALVYALSLISADPVMGGAWPLPQAVAAGVLVGLLNAAVQAPLSAGVLAGAYWLLEGDAAAEDEARTAGDEQPHAEAPTDEAARAAAAALSAQEAAELDLRHDDVDKAGAESDLSGSELAGPEPAGDDLSDAEPHPEVAPSSDSEPHESEPHEATHHSAPEDPAAAEQEVDHSAPPPRADEDAHAHAAAEDAATAAAAAAAAGALEGEAEVLPPPPEPEPELEPEPQPEPEFEPEPEPPAAHGRSKWGVEPLSPWPHSVLPPWPVKHAFEPPPKRAPLARGVEPAQPSMGAMERE
jgi:hypothetical protein